MNRFITFIGLGSLSIIAVSLVFFSSGDDQNKEKTAGRLLDIGASPDGENLVAEKTTTSAAGASGSANASAQTMAAGTITASGTGEAGAKNAETPPRSDRAFPYERELSEYARLKKQIFETDEARAEKARLFADSAFLHSLGELLRRPASLGDRLQELQNDAVDLLLEARTTSGSHEAATVLRSVVQDDQIEGNNLDLATRQGLAGVKADVMYNWSALEPDRIDDIQKWLPGPVSQHIWRNVLEAHDSNGLESAQELAGH